MEQTLPDPRTPPAAGSVRDESQANELKLFLPPLGFGAAWFLWIVGGFFSVPGIVFAIVICHDAFTGGIKAPAYDPPSYLWVLFPLPFLLIGLSFLWFAYRLGRRQAVITLDAAELRITYAGIFGTKQGQWQRGEVADVRSQESDFTVNDRPVRELQIQLRDGSRFDLLSGRGDAEVEWVASTLRQALQLPPPPPSPPRPHPATEVLAKRAKLLKAFGAKHPVVAVILVLIALLGAGVGREYRAGVTKEGEAVILKEGFIFPWEDHPSAAQCPEAKEFRSLEVKRWYVYGFFRSSSWHGSRSSNGPKW